MSGRGKRGVSYVQSEEPTFIRQFKERVGYKEESTVEAKKEVLKLEDEDRSDNEDEQPTIVALRDGDLTADEVKLMKEKDKESTYDDMPEDGKITFKKPVKRQSSETSDLKVTTSKKQKEEDKKESKKKEKKHKKNTNLLSFGDDDEEENT